MSLESIQPLARRRFLKSAGSVCVAGFLAGCGEAGGPTPTPKVKTVINERTVVKADRAPGEQAIHALWEKLKQEAAPPEGKITVAFGFLEQVPITTEVYLPAADAGLWDMSTHQTADLSEVSLLKQPPKALPSVKTDELRGFYAFMEPGQEAKVALTVRNEQDKVQFIAAPPDLKPYGLYQGLVANCYCNGLTYTVPQNGTWVRVIRAKLRQAVSPGAVGLAVWPVVPGEGGSGGENGTAEFGGWFSDVSNYDGVEDRTGQSQVSVAVGTKGNGGNFAFEPPAITVSTGTTVVWEWTGKGGAHNVVDNNGAFRSGDPVDEEGTMFEYTFDQTGTYKYYCAPHKPLGMKGAVVVE